jgi:hypothetical protein
MDSHRKTCVLTFAAASPRAKPWRYLDVNCRLSPSFVYGVAQSGLLRWALPSLSNSPC